MKTRMKFIWAWIMNNKEELEKIRLYQLLEDFDNNSIQIHNESNRNLPQNVIYHYTSHQGLVGIIKKKRLRYSDYRYLNDPTELKYSVNLIKDAILQSPLTKINYLVWQIFSILENIDQYYKVYICSFSEREKLSLWRYYGSNGTGFAIGFNQNFIKINPNAKLGSSMLCNVIYGKEKSKNEIYKFINGCIVTLQKAGENAVRDRNFVNRIAGKLLSHLIPLLPVFKDESFEDEEEIRLVHTEGSLLKDKRTGKPYFIDDKYREFVPIKQNYDLPFVNFLQGKKPAILPDEISTSDISEIIIGPSCEYSEARAAIRKLLLENNFDIEKIEIRQANFSYRP